MGGGRGRSNGGGGVIYSILILVPQKILNKTSNFLIINTEKVSLQQKTESWKQILLMHSVNVLENCCL